METTNAINYVTITTANDPILEKVERTYISSFPESERRDFKSVKQLLQENPLFTMHILFKDNQYAGFITSWLFPDFIYVEHFAIDESARNGGIGGKAMQHFLETSAYPVVLEVELPEDEMSRRRIGFYERLGFRLDDHAYHQPPYGPDRPWIDLRLMTYGDIDLNQMFETVKDYLYRDVYQVE